MKAFLKLAAASAMAVTLGVGRADASFTINVFGQDFTIDFYQGPVAGDGASWNEYLANVPSASDPAIASGKGTPWYESTNGVAEPGFTAPVGGGAPNPYTAGSYAKEFANQFVLGFSDTSGNTPPAIPSVGQAYAFGYSEVLLPGGAAANIASWAAVYEGHGNFTVFDAPLVTDSEDGFPAPGGGSANPINWAYLVPLQQEVPEIDGPVLAQVGFVLAGLYFVMLGRRRRGDDVDMSQAA